MFNKNTAQETTIKTINGPVIIIACPGSGKTTTLIRRIHNMLENGIKGENILMLTFSRNSATDMKKRYEMSYGSLNGITFRTYHSLCLAILAEEGLYSKEDVIDPGTVYIQIYKRLTDWHHMQDCSDVTRNIINEISLIKTSKANLKTYKPTSCEKQIFKDVYEDYQKMLENSHKVDYDDMLLLTERLLREDEKVLEKWQDRFTYIQCDEYQDTNILQRDIVYMLADKNKNICVVGDDDQSIYAFRGAFPQVMFDFPKDYKNAKVINMSTNYRSAQDIVNIADVLIKKNKKRFDKEFVSYRGCKGEMGNVHFDVYASREDEINHVISQIEKHHSNGIPYNEMAIIYRNNNLAGMPIAKLVEKEIPFKTKEKLKSVYDTWVFKALCAYIYLSDGRWQQKYIDTIISTPYKYLKRDKFKDCPYERGEMIKRLSYISEKWRLDRARGEIIDIFTAFGPGKVTLESDPEKAIRAMEFIGFRDAIEKRAINANEDVDEAIQMIDKLAQDAHKFKTIKDWLRFAAGDIRRVEKINKERRNDDGVEVLTMHASKGCEWQVVFVIDVTQNTIPHKNVQTESEIEEERRLLYVALTRSKDILEVCSLNPKSVFLDELRLSGNKSCNTQKQGE